MKDQWMPESFSAVMRYFQDTIALGRVLPLLPRLAPVYVAERPRSASGTPRRTPRSRRPLGLLLLVGFVLLAASPTWAGQPVLPPDVPNIYDPEVQLHYVPAEVRNLRDNPDFPMVLFVNTDGEQPRALLLGVDARNGKDTWSLISDPIVLIGVFADEMTMERLYVDTGFMGRGRASGQYTVLEEQNSSALPGLLRAVTAADPRTDI